MATNIPISLGPSISTKLAPLNLGNYTAALKTSGGNNLLAGKALDEIQESVNRLTRAAQSTGTSTISISDDILLQEVTLTADTEIAAEFTAAEHEVLAVFVNQDSTGGHAITWDPASFRNSPPTYVDPAGAVTGETPTGTIDGSNKVFTLTRSPNPYTSLVLKVNSVTQVQGTDYTLVGNVITFASAPAGGSTITADFSVLASTLFFFVGRTDPIDGVARWFFLAAWPESPASTSQVIFEQEVTLTANAVINAAQTPIVDTLLVVFITQDSTGGWSITWGSDFETSTPQYVDPTAKALTKVLFVGRTDPIDSVVKWFFLSNSALVALSGADVRRMFTWGVDTDGTGTDLIGKYGHASVLSDMVPVRGSISMVTLPASADTYFDILYSSDYGATWTSIFPGSTPPTTQLLFPKLPAMPPANPQLRYEFTNFQSGTKIPKLSVLRLDGLQSGGGAGVEITLECEVANLAGLDGQFNLGGGNGTGILMLGMV